MNVHVPKTERFYLYHFGSKTGNNSAIKQLRFVFMYNINIDISDLYDRTHIILCISYASLSHSLAVKDIAINHFVCKRHAKWEIFEIKCTVASRNATVGVTRESNKKLIQSHDPLLFYFMLKVEWRLGNMIIGAAV